MKKNSFVEGAMIATIGIVISKIIGVLYVIPFYQIIGVQGSNLYGYAYSIYAIFLSLSIGGIPVAMSKIISEYNTLGYYNTKERAYRIGLLMISFIGFVSFIILMIAAPFIAKAILGDVTGGNTVKGVTLVIRIISSALLIVPVLSVTKGYFQGHKIMTPPTLAAVLEQIVRVVIILVGSFSVLKIFHLSLETAVGVSVFAATIGALAAYFYLFVKKKTNIKSLNVNAKMTSDEKKISTKDIAKKILFYAIPFIIIDLLRSSFTMIDTFTVVRTLGNLGYDGPTAETALNVIDVWGSKLNMIVISLAVGFTMSLIPNIASSYVKKDFKEISHKINQALQVLVLLIVPMVMGLFILSRPIWITFYSYNTVSINIFSLFVFQALTYSFYAILIDTTQTMNNTKIALGTLIGSFVLKVIINVPLMHLFHQIGLEAYYAPVVATLFTQALAVIFLLSFLKKKYKINYKDTLNRFLKTILCTSTMVLTLLIIKVFIPINSTTKIGALKEIFIFAFIGSIVFVIVGIYSKLFEEVLGKDFIDKVKNTLRKIKNKIPFLKHNI